MVILEFRRSATPSSGLTRRLFPKQRHLHFPAQNARVGKREHMVLHQPLLWDPPEDTWFSRSLLTPVAFRQGEQLPFPEKGHPGASNPPGRLGRRGPPARPPLVSALQLHFSSPSLSPPSPVSPSIALHPRSYSALLGVGSGEMSSGTLAFPLP